MLDQQPRYDSYQDTGFPWIGDVPKHWNSLPLIALATPRKISGHPHYELLSVYLDKGVIRFSDVDEKRTNTTSEDLSNYQVVEPGDFVLNNQQAWRGSVGVSVHQGLVSPAYIVLKLSEELAPKFANYLFRDQSMVAHYLISSKGVGTIQRNLYWPKLKRVPVFYPDLDTQNRIVSFLDEKTAEIDAAIGKKRRLIDLLNEQKAILINRAVTKSLNHDAPMKDSGVDWIGEIPAHWDVKRNAALFDESKKSGTTDLPVLSVSIHHGVSRSELSEEENLRSAIKIADRTSYVEVLPGYVAYNMMRAWQGGIGAVHTHGMVSPAYVVARPRGPIHADYFERLYRTDNFIGQMDQFSKGITDFRKRLYWEEFKTLLTLVPPIEEQVKIADFCQVIVDACKDAVKATQAEISTLNEFKQTLIANAVTGKIKI